ncbi:hypothetical protein L1887_56004 [Cichorium endivia]|nr:hypothetical protein L1887_56004 [Cichorium endivia]
MRHETGAEYMGRVEVICGQAHAAKAIQRGQTAGWLSMRICVAASTRTAGRRRISLWQPIKAEKLQPTSAKEGDMWLTVKATDSLRISDETVGHVKCGSVRSTKQRASRSPTTKDMSTVGCRTGTSKRESISQLHRNEVRAGASQMLFISGAACEAPPKSAWICLRRA